MNKSAVHELQRAILSADCDINNSLRMAYIISKKLNLADFEKWVSCELNGYTDNKEIPEYRNIRGILVGWNPYHGWMPTVLENTEIADKICMRKTGQPLSSLIDLYSNSKSTSFEMPFEGDMLTVLNDMFDFPIKTNYALKVSASQIKQIVESVKNCLLEWSLKLENIGITGEDFSFTSEEKDIARNASQTINNFFGNTSIVSSHTENSATINGDKNHIAIEVNRLDEIIDQIKKAVDADKLNDDSRETAKELVVDVEDKVKKGRSKGIIKSALVGLKDFLSTVGTGTALALIEQAIGMLF